jgi:hypothetical protein
METDSSYVGSSSGTAESLSTERKLLQRWMELCEKGHGQSVALEMRAALDAQPKYACHCDLDPGMKPDDCVFDNGDIDDCVYATRLQREGKGKRHCVYWQPIKFA